MPRIDSFLRLRGGARRERPALPLRQRAHHPVRGRADAASFRVLRRWVRPVGSCSRLLGEEQRADFEKTQEADLVYSIEGVARFRVNIFVQSHGLGAVFRVIPNRTPTLEDLQLPPAVKKLTPCSPTGWCWSRGPTGSGQEHHVGGDGGRDQQDRRTATSSASRIHDRVPPPAHQVRDHPAPGGQARRVVLQSRSARRSARAPTCWWSARCATWRPSISPSPPRRPACW